MSEHPVTAVDRRETKGEAGKYSEAPMYVVVNDSERNGWRLNLYALAYYSFMHVHPDLDGDPWRALKQKYGLVATRQIDGSYTGLGGTNEAAKRTAPSGNE